MSEDYIKAQTSAKIINPIHTWHKKPAIKRQCLDAHAETVYITYIQKGMMHRTCDSISNYNAAVNNMVYTLTVVYSNKDMMQYQHTANNKTLSDFSSVLAVSKNSIDYK